MNTRSWRSNSVMLKYFGTPFNYNMPFNSLMLLDEYFGTPLNFNVKIDVTYVDVLREKDSNRRRGNCQFDVAFR